MSLALMVDAQGDGETLAAQAKMRADARRLDPEDPRSAASGRLSADRVHARRHGAEPSARRRHRPASGRNPGRADSAATMRAMSAGYFIESAINHYSMTDRKDARLYNAAKKLADCWADHIGPAPKQEWFDGHQEMEQALVRFGRFVNEVEGDRQAVDRYIALAKFLLDCRTKAAREYDQSHLPVDAAVRGGRPRRARGLHLLRDGRRRRRDARRRLPERRQVALGQHRPPQVLPDGRRRQRRDVGRLRPGLFAAATTPTASRARAAAKSSSSGSCTSRITTRSTPTSTNRRSTTRLLGALDLKGETSTTPTRWTPTSSGRRGTCAHAASATSRARC